MLRVNPNAFLHCRMDSAGLYIPEVEEILQYNNNRLEWYISHMEDSLLNNNIHYVHNVLRYIKTKDPHHLHVYLPMLESTKIILPQ